MSRPDFIAPENDKYSDIQWWDEEFKKCKKGDIYEWYTNAKEFWDILNKFLKEFHGNDISILNLGCGISKVQDFIYDQGYKNITNCDGSPSCISLMKSEDTRGMKWDVVNLLERFPYSDSSFDFALDKATLDALITEKADKWEPDPEAFEISEKYFKEVDRVLKPDGIFIQISFGQPHFRRKLFERDIYNWDVEVQTIQPGQGFHFFLYICKKKK
ncbi:Endothelin-converting enzyme 2 [Tritrichomonas musculus]|uniref:Endothelin-converting enzyme 2 n=1 Tax=Tritrichomonas musculus TaxID=1915356 RepID=A0ABR2JXL3_9EUKA